MEDKSCNSVWKDPAETTEWNDPQNWEPNAVPMKKARFSESNQTVISFSDLDSVKIGEIAFEPDAPPYSFQFGSGPNKPILEINGFGITNRSGVNQSFIVAGTAANFRFPQLKFANYATAGGSDMTYQSGPESLDGGAGGGIIAFSDHSTAGTARFILRTGKVPPPRTLISTVGGEVVFCDFSTAERAEFTSYGSLGIDGDTFGNTVFHDHATADHAKFTNVGGTVTGGDGGNTHFYDSSSASHGIFNNYGATFSTANGGGVAFNGVADGAHGHFLNYPATVGGGNGGVTSFNNNPPEMNTQGASAGHGIYHNYGATDLHRGGGGHTEFSAKYGCPTGANAIFINYGSAISGRSTAGHTRFSMNFPTQNFPTAGNGVFRNLPALAADADPGNTSFTVYSASAQSAPISSNHGRGINPFSSQPKDKVPTAGEGMFINEGAFVDGAAGGYTSFSEISSAGNSRLIAYGGGNGGQGGKLIFNDWATGGTATIQLFGNGNLDLSGMKQEISFGVLDVAGGVITMALGTNDFRIDLSVCLILNASVLTFTFLPRNTTGFEFNRSYTILSAPNLSSFNSEQFVANAMQGVLPTFKIAGNTLEVSYSKA